MSDGEANLDLADVFAYIDAHRQEFLERLFAYLSMPSVSAHGLGIAEVAEHIGSSPRHVRRLIDRGQLPIVRLGKLVRITPDDLAHLIAVSRQ